MLSSIDSLQGHLFMKLFTAEQCITSYESDIPPGHAAMTNYSVGWLNCRKESAFKEDGCMQVCTQTYDIPIGVWCVNQSV